jgi:hypothetical protein
MRRDLGPIRELLLKLEALPVRPGRFTTITPGGTEMAVEGYGADQITYHIELLKEVGFIEYATSEPLNGATHFQRLSWNGHDYLDAIRDPEIWKKTMRGAEATGSWTFDLVRDLAKGLIKTKIEEHTGVKL